MDVTKETLHSICEDLYLMTGIKAGVYDVNFQEVFAHSKTMGAFCTAIRRNPDLCAKCLECDRRGFLQCQQTGQMTLYRCHMGLTEAIAPIADNGIPSGYLMFGQILSEGDRTNVLRSVAELEDAEFLQNEVNRMRETDENTIRAAARLVVMCANYIHLLNVLGPVHNLIEVQITQYIRNHLGDRTLSMQKICTTFCISRGTLYNISKRAFGMGITPYIRSQRLAQALEWIESTNLPMYEIADRCGFSDPDYLTRLIRQKTNKTPRMLRHSR